MLLKEWRIMRITIRNVFNTNDIEELASEIEAELKNLGKIKKPIKTDDATLSLN